MRELVVDGESAMSSGMAKICMVCGDKALGFNFNAITCESCKAFFRRNALSNKEFTCPFTEDCKVTVVTRRFCQKCRLQKCFEVGMKKEYIMSEEDKVMKRRKIEQNRARKRMSGMSIDGQSTTSHEESANIGGSKVRKDRDTTHISPPSYISESDGHMLSSPVTPSIKREINLASPENIYESPRPLSSMASSSSSCSYDVQQHFSPMASQNLTPGYSDYSPRPGPSTSKHPHDEMDATSESSPSDIVASIIHSKIGTKNTMDKLMKTPKDAVFIMSKIISSPKDAMELIGHLIQSPGDGLHIISKIMNSPLDALTVFTQFMSSPTDAFQIIGKIMSSPADVLQFMQQLMNSPEDALQIMNKFMNAPVEALKIINKMINHQQADVSTTVTGQSGNNDGTDEFDTQNIVIRSVLESADSRQPNLYFNSQSPNDVQPNPNSSSSCKNNSTPQEQLQKTEDIINEVLKDIESVNGVYECQSTVTSSPSSENAMSTSINSTFGSILNEAIRLEYESYNIIEQSSCSGKDLNSIEQEKLKELIEASETLYEPIDDEFDIEDSFWQSQPMQDNSDLIRVINLTAVAIRRFIKMAKKINAFKNMCQEDQLALLKGSCIEMMILHSLTQYDENENKWTIPQKTRLKQAFIRVDILKLSKFNVYEKLHGYVRSFENKWRYDNYIIPVMCAITLFTPNRSRTIHSDVIKLEQTSYYCLLRRYIESIYPPCEAKSTFLKLLYKIKELKRLNEEFIHVYLDVNPTQVEPLLLEIFDLKLRPNNSL